MKLLSRSRSKAVNQKQEKATSSPTKNSSANDLERAKEDISVLELKLQQRNEISTKNLENFVQLEQKLKQRDSDLSVALSEITKLEGRAENLEDHLRCSNSEISQLKTRLRHRDAQLSYTENEITEAKESLWEQRKASLYTASLLAQAEEDLILARAENNGKELEMLKISNQAMRKQLEDADTRAELDRKAFIEDKNRMDYILHKSQQEYETYRAKAKQNKRTVSILKPQVEIREQQLRTSRENEEKIMRKYDELERNFQRKIQQEKQWIMEANDWLTDKLRRELASASQELKQEQIRYERLCAREKALVHELRKQLEAKDKENDLTEARLVQYGWDLQSRLDEQNAQSNLMFSSSEDMTKEGKGNTHIPSPVGVESEKQKLLEALIPASNHRTQLNGSLLRATTSIAELITTAFELRQKSILFASATNREMVSPNPKTSAISKPYS